MSAPAMKLGPWAVVDDGSWPAAWRGYAARTFMPGPAATTPRLTVRLRRMHADAVQSSSVAVNTMQVTVHPASDVGVMQVAIQTASIEARLQATLATDAVLDIDVLAHAEDAHLTFGNALRGAVAWALPCLFDGLMLHASSGVLDDGVAARGAVFSGVSTAGKTTLALGMERARFLSDDISLIQHCSRAPLLRESPFFGSAGRRGADVDAPLAVVCLLGEKSTTGTRVTRLARAEAVPLLLRHVVSFTNTKAHTAALLGQVDALLQRVPAVRVERDLAQSADEVFAEVLRVVGAAGA